MGTKKAIEKKSKPLTQKQRSLLEKAVRIRYNGFIGQLRNTQTKAEIEERNECMSSLVHLPTNECTYHRGTYANTVSKYPTAWKREADKLCNLAQKYEDKRAAMDKDLRAKVNAFNVKIDKENELRCDRKRQARQALHSEVSRLENERDQKIMDIAFQGQEDIEVTHYLNALPNVIDILDMLKRQGGELAEEPTSITGVGETNPKGLISGN